MVDIISAAISTLTFFGIYLILSISLNLEYGYAGQPNFGVVAFYAAGAYVAGNIANLMLLPFGSGLDPFMPEAVSIKLQAAAQNPFLSILFFITALLSSALIVGAFGYLASYPALRVKEDFLAIVLLAFGEILRVIVRNYYPIAGGTVGLGGIPNPFAWIGQTQLIRLSYMITVLGLAGGVYFFAEKISNSPYGRMLKSIRDDDLASSFFGKKVPWVRGQIMFIGSMLAGIAGALYAMYSGYVQADDFLPFKTFEIWVMVMVGGLANNKGVVCGALLMTFAEKILGIVSVELSLLKLPLDPSYFRYVIYGIIMLVILLYRPSGIIREAPLKTPAWKVIKENE